MSKRKGDYITVEDLVNEVGKDATRFIMLNRSSDVELDFDFDNVIDVPLPMLCPASALEHADINSMDAIAMILIVAVFISCA